MSAVLNMLAAEAVDAKLQRYREKTAIARTARINCAMQRNLPYEEEDGGQMSVLMGVLHEIASRPSPDGNSGGETDGPTDSGATPGGGEEGGTQTPAPSVRPDPAPVESSVTSSPSVNIVHNYGERSPGNDQDGNGETEPGGSSEGGSTDGRSNAYWSWLKPIAKWALIAAGTGAGLGGGWAGLTAIINAFGGDEADPGVVVPREAGLGEWIEGNNWHIGEE